MKRPILLNTIALLFTLPLCSDQSQNINTLMVARDADNSESGVGIEAEYEHLFRAKFLKPNSSRHSHVSISSSNILASYLHAVNEKIAYTVGVGYSGLKFDFTKHKAFSQEHFHNALFNIAGETKEIDRWKWKADLLTQINTDHFSLSRYTFFTGLLKGKYDWHKNRHLYVGILTYAGMHYSRVLPVIGFDYIFNDKWKLNIVYPLTTYLRYTVNKSLSFEAGVRYYLTRQRLQEDDKIRRGFVAFRNWSAEIGVNWNYNKLIEFNAHVGQSLSNRMRVSNHHDSHRKHYRMDNAPVFGIIASVKV